MKLIESTLIHNIKPEELTVLLQEIIDQIAALKKDFQPKDPVEYLTRNEVAKLLKCDLSTIWNWQNKGKLKSYGMGNRVYFKRSEIEASLISLNKGSGTKDIGLGEM